MPYSSFNLKIFSGSIQEIGVFYKNGLSAENSSLYNAGMPSVEGIVQ
jgi:hypothetical protein